MLTFTAPMEEEQTQGQQTTTSSPNNDYNIIAPSRRNDGGKKLLLIILVLLIVGGAVGGFIFISNQGEQEEVAPTPTPTEVPSPTPTPAQTTPTPTRKPTPTEKLSPTPTKKATKSITLKVLNGSGVTGAARQAADYLSNLGYEILGVGNAPISDLEKTTIEIKKDKESSLAQLKIDLETKYSLGTTSATLSATESADAIVTVGKK